MTTEERLELLEKRVEELESQLPKKRFTPPTVKQVFGYLFEKGMVDYGERLILSEMFVNFYESKDWKIGKNRMSSWKSAVNTWLIKNKRDGTSNGNSKSRGSEGRMDAIRDF